MFGSRRIATRIFLGYLLPLLFFLVAGVVLPYLLAGVLGQAMRDYTQSDGFLDSAYALRRSVVDNENQLRGFLLYGDTEFREQFKTSRDEYRQRYRNMQDLLPRDKDNMLSSYLEIADASYRDWLDKKATPEFAAADRLQTFKSRNAAASEAAALRSAKSFETVGRALDRLVEAAQEYRAQQFRRAQVSELWSTIFTFATPVVGMLLAVLLARFFTLGITGPIEELRLAAEEVERGDTTRLLLEDYSHGEDEIGDLGKALSRMASTISERETVLRAQNEALVAIGRRIEAVLNSTNDGIVLLDRAEGFSLVNARFAAIFGLNSDDVLDQTFAQAGGLFLDRFKDKATAKARFHEWINDPESIVEETMEAAEPTAKVLRIYTAPVRGEIAPGGKSKEPEIIGRIFVFRDVTRETIVDRMKTEFVSTVSHELRTPLTAIKGYVDLMISGKTGELNDTQTEFLTMVQASTRRLTDLINDMLDISRIESGRIAVRRESVDYLPLVREAMRMMANQAEARQITLHLEAPEAPLPSVRGDVDRITQVLVNLLSNAIKYTPSGGDVTVLLESEEGVVTTCVADTGIGINVEDQSRLFQKFFRADNSTTREVGGTGLGLAITRAILERMHGTIRVESELGKGSRFIFTMPIADERGKGNGKRADSGGLSVTTSPTSSGTMLPVARGLLLIVDEDPAILHRLSGLFRGRNFVTSGAMNYSEAMRRARDLHPDAVLINLAASRLNVLGLLHSLRTNPETERLTIFLVALRHFVKTIEPRHGVTVLPSDEPSSEDALELTVADTAETFAARLATLKAGLPERITVNLSLDDFVHDDNRAESLALALQQQLIRGKGVILQLRDSTEQGTGDETGLVSLASPGDTQGDSLERIAESVGSQLRQGGTNGMMGAKALVATPRDPSTSTVA